METLLVRALGRWRGPALTDVPGASWALGETARLEQLRIGALESWLTTLIQMGRAAEAVAEVEAAVEAAPSSDGAFGPRQWSRSTARAGRPKLYARIRSCGVPWPKLVWSRRPSLSTSRGLSHEVIENCQGPSGRILERSTHNQTEFAASAGIDARKLSTSTKSRTTHSTRSRALRERRLCARDTRHQLCKLRGRVKRALPNLTVRMTYR